MIYWSVYWLILFLGGGALLALLIYLQRTKPSAALTQNFVLMILSLFLTFMAAEFYFKVFFAQPDALMTLAAQNWYQRYYDGTINSLGYRDREWSAEDVSGKMKIMVVGDSFVEGVGIEYPTDRFPDLLAQKLGPDYAILNLGKRRANTVQEIEAIVNYPLQPDVLVLSYFINDIDNVRWWYNLDRGSDPSVPPLLSPLVRNSYLFNFLYWRLFRLFPSEQHDAEWQHLQTLYNDTNAWWLHQQDLLSIYEGTQSEGVPLLVVVFPSMNRPADSRDVVDRVVYLFAEKGVSVLDVTELIKDHPTEELVASPVDPHPSELVHQLVADALFKMLIEQGLAQETEAVR